MINAANNYSRDINSLQNTSSMSNNLATNGFSQNTNFSQSPIMLMLFSFIVSILQQLISQQAQNPNADNNDEPTTKSQQHTDSGNPNSLSNISDQQDKNILNLYDDLVTSSIIEQAKQDGLTRPYTISDEDRSGRISTGDLLLVGNQIDGSFQKKTLSDSDVSAINQQGATDSGNPSPLNNISDQQNANILFLFKDIITPEILERTKDFSRSYMISDDDGSGSISVGDRLLVGDNIHGDLQEHQLSADDLRMVNSPGALG